MRVLQMIALGVFLGSIPFAHLAVYLRAGRIMPKPSSGMARLQEESGTAGVLLVQALDLTKGFLPVWLASLYLDSPIYILLTGAGCVVSHLFPYWFMFKYTGGAQAVMLGALAGLCPLCGAFCLLVWSVVYLATRRRFASSAIAAACAPIVLAFTGKGLEYVLVSVTGLVYIGACGMAEHMKRQNQKTETEKEVE